MWEVKRGVTNLKRFFDGSAFVEILALVELVSCTVGQAGVKANVLFIVRERPEGDAQLERFGNGLPGLFNYFEGDVGSYDARAQLRKRQHAAICKLSYNRLFKIIQSYIWWKEKSNKISEHILFFFLPLFVSLLLTPKIRKQRREDRMKSRKKGSEIIL